jgi:hypothetical protein
MAKQQTAWIDKSDVRGTENIGFCDCFEVDIVGAVSAFRWKFKAIDRRDAEGHAAVRL